MTRGIKNKEESDKIIGAAWNSEESANKKPDWASKYGFRVHQQANQMAFSFVDFYDEDIHSTQKKLEISVQGTI